MWLGGRGKGAHSRKDRNNDQSSVGKNGDEALKKAENSRRNSREEKIRVPQEARGGKHSSPIGGFKVQEVTEAGQTN